MLGLSQWICRGWASYCRPGGLSRDYLDLGSMIVGVLKQLKARLRYVVTSLAGHTLLPAYCFPESKYQIHLRAFSLPDHANLPSRRSVYCHGRPLEPSSAVSEALMLSCRQLERTKQGSTASKKPHVLAEKDQILEKSSSVEKMSTPTRCESPSSPTYFSPERSACSMSRRHPRRHRRRQHPPWI
jgi:hypothetical protein